MHLEPRTWALSSHPIPAVRHRSPLVNSILLLGYRKTIVTFSFRKSTTFEKRSNHILPCSPRPKSTVSKSVARGSHQTMTTTTKTQSNTQRTNDRLRMQGSPHALESDALLDEQTITQYAQYGVLDAQGVSHPLQELVSGDRCLIIFVRHFFCGMCQDFLRSLSQTITHDDLKASKPPTSVAIIGCGQPERISDYASDTGCPFPIYADPSRKLYEAFGMPSSLSMGEQRPSYQTRGLLSMTTKSIIQGVSAGTGALKGGNFAQIGGEFLFEDGSMTWCHRMTNTRNHTEADDLKRLLRL